MIWRQRQRIEWWDHKSRSDNSYQRCGDARTRASTPPLPTLPGQWIQLSDSDLELLIFRTTPAALLLFQAFCSMVVCWRTPKKSIEPWNPSPNIQCAWAQRQFAWPAISLLAYSIVLPQPSLWSVCSVVSWELIWKWPAQRSVWMMPVDSSMGPNLVSC